jgi:hypothetical protein
LFGQRDGKRHDGASAGASAREAVHGEAVGRGDLRVVTVPWSHSPQELTPTTSTPTAAGTILALDLGKFKTGACASGPASAQAYFHTVPTSRQDLRKLFAPIQPARVVCEACALGRSGVGALDGGTNAPLRWREALRCRARGGPPVPFLSEAS